MNLSDLEVPPPQQIQRTSIEATDKDADFLSLRLLNKRTRVKLSPEPLDLQPLPGKGQLFSVANSKGWFVAAIRHASSDISLIFSPLAELRLAFSNATPDDAEQVFTPQRAFPFAPATPNIIALASADTRLVVGLTQGPVLVFDTARLFTPGSDEIAPLHSFPSTTSSAPRQILPNPGDMPALVAVLRDGDGHPGRQLVEIVDVEKLESVGGWRSGNSPDATPTSLSWSPKGKQIAVGLQSGDIITFGPLETNKPKLVYGKPPSASNQSIISTTWLSPPIIHTIYASPGSLSPDAEQTHIVLSLDKSKHLASDIKLSTPYFPSPAIRPPGSFTVVLRNWEPAKFIVLVGDSSSSDIGVIGSLSDDVWYNFSLEETSTPSLPLDKDMNDTVLIALELDLTSTESYRHTGTGEAIDLPPPPIMYAYVSDGTLLGWYIVNSQGQAYNGMVSASASLPTIIAPDMSTSISQRDMQMSTAPVTPVSEPAIEFGQETLSQPAFQQSSFLRPQSSTSAFGQPSPFGQLSQPSSAFGQSSSFGQASSTSPFGQTSSSPTFGSNTSSGGFGTFSSAKFGQATFGFGTSPPPTQSTSPPPAPPAEDDMASDDAHSFGGMSLGSSSQSDLKQSPVFGSGSIFGRAALSPIPSNDEKSSSAFGSSEFIKPASGFGAFSNLTSQPSTFGSTIARDVPTSDAPTTSSAFGKSGFETKHSGAFGQSAFGQLGFGQPNTFGKSGFGTISTPSSGGFATFSAGGPNSFASATGGDTKAVQPTSGGFDAFAQSGPSAFTSAASSSSNAAWASGGNQDAFGAVQASSDAKSVFSGVNNGNTSSSGNMTGFVSSAGRNENAIGGSVFPTGQSTSGDMEVKGEPKDVEIPSTPKPTTATKLRSPPLSPPLCSVDSRSSPFGKNESTPPFKSSQPASGTGAFGQLKTSSTGFKPAEGFGAFGSSVNKDSAFYNPPKEVGTRPVSTFASSSGTFIPTNTPPKSGSTKPAFGTPSVLGGSKPAFGLTSALGGTTKSPFGSASTPAPTTAEPTSGGFGAFSNKSAFGSLIGAKTSSFADLLRGEDAKDPSKPSKSVFAAAEDDVNSLESISLAQEKPKLPSPKSLEGDPNISGLKSPEQEKGLPVHTTSEGAASSRLSPVPNEMNEDVDRPGESNVLGKDKDAGEPPVTSSLSQSSSFVEVSAPSDEEGQVKSDRPSESGSDLEDDTQSFLSESFSSEDSPDDELSDEEVDSDEDEELPRSSPEHPTDPTEVPLPPTPQAKSRSPSTTPKPESLSAMASKSLSPPPVSSTPTPEKTYPIPTQGGSTTPPGSPPKEASSVCLLESSVPVHTPFPIGLGRPSTRPTRSSPLASTAPLAVGGRIPASKSASSLILKPASPKQPFGILGPEQTQKYLPSKDHELSQVKRPKTPPLLSGGTAPTTKLPSLGGSPLTSTSNIPSGSPKAPSPPNLLDAKSSGSSSGPSITPAPSPQPLNVFRKSTTPTPPAPGSIFGGPSLTTPPPMPSMSNNLPVPPSTSFFGSQVPVAPSATPPPIERFAGQPAEGSGMPLTPPASGLVGTQRQVVIATTTAIPIAELLQGQGMQAQCAFLFTHMTKELDTLRQHAQRTKTMREGLSKASGLSRRKDNLTDTTHWTMGDINTWGQVLKTLRDEIEQINESRRDIYQTLCGLESNMLRAGTKKEEIARFNKAKTDPEFAKMLKVRTLGPEHLETQSQLRRDIRTMRDRVQKLEDHLEASKKKLAQMKAGRPGLRAPTLDTINRTYRNIDIAIDYQAQQVALMTSRLKKLKMPPNQFSSHPLNRDKRLPDPKGKPNKPLYLTRPACDALNSERSAHKLKVALLSVREQPLLNTIAAVAPAAPLAFITPTKPLTKVQSPSFNFDLEPYPLPESALLPTFNSTAFDESQLQGTDRRAAHLGVGRGKNHHAPSVKSKRYNPSLASAASPPPAANFDWGPLPVIPQKTGLPFGFSKSPSVSQ